MTRREVIPWWQQQFRAPTDPRKVMTVDRRPIVPVNALGTGESTTYDRLSDRQKRKFDAQFAAWRAACELTEATGITETYGEQVPDRMIDAWLTARRAWERIR